MNMSFIITEEKMVLLILMILSVMVTILSSFPHLHIPFNKILVLMGNLFLLVKWYVKEPIYFQSILIIIVMF